MDRKLIDYLPEIIAKIREFKLLTTAEDPEFELLWQSHDEVVNNMFIDSCDMDALTRYEKIFHILANPETENEEFRKKRLKISLSTEPPFSYRWLLIRLDVLYGSENLDITFDPNNYRLDIGVELGSKNLLALVKEFTEAVVPANIILTVELIYNTWEMIASMTWGQASTLTWNELKTEVL
jgi:hypothetical protein